MAKKDNLTLGQIRKRMWSVPSYDTSNAKRTGDFIEGIPVYQNPDGMRILKREDAEMRMSNAERQEAVQELKAAQNYGSPSSSDSLGSKDVLTPEEYRRYRLDNTLETMQKNSEEMTKKYGTDWRNSSPYGMSVGNDKDSVLPLYFTPAWPVAAGMNTTNAVQNYNRGSRTEYVWDKDSQQSVPVNVPYDGKNLAVDMALEWAVPGAMHVGGNAIAKYGLKGAVPGLMRDIRELPKNVGNSVVNTLDNAAVKVLDSPIGNIDVKRFTPRLSEARAKYYGERSVPLRDALKYQRDRFKFTLENPENKPRFWVNYNSYNFPKSISEEAAALTNTEHTPFSLQESAKASTEAFKDLKSKNILDMTSDTYYSPLVSRSDAARVQNAVDSHIKKTKYLNEMIDSGDKLIRDFFPGEENKWLTDLLDSPYRDQLLPIVYSDILNGGLSTNTPANEYIKDLLSRVYGDLYRGVRIKGTDINNPHFSPTELYTYGTNLHGKHIYAPNLNTSQYNIARGYSVRNEGTEILPTTLQDAKIEEILTKVKGNGTTIRYEPSIPVVYKYTPKLDGVIDPTSLTRSIENVNKMFDDSNIRIVGDYFGPEGSPLNTNSSRVSRFVPDTDTRPLYLTEKRGYSDGIPRDTYTIFEAKDEFKPYSFNMFNATPMDPLQPVPESLENSGTILPLLYDRSGNFAK